MNMPIIGVTASRDDRERCRSAGNTWMPSSGRGVYR